MNRSIHTRLMQFGKISGCHQMPERSFFIHGKQFPVCARCTGVLIGTLSAYFVFTAYVLPVKFCVMGCSVMFADWFIQYAGICTSTNIRRLITGIVGGYSLATFHCMVIKNIMYWLTK